MEKFPDILYKIDAKETAPNKTNNKDIIQKILFLHIKNSRDFGRILSFFILSNIFFSRLYLSMFFFL
jgi:hypothetical protein